MPQKSFQLIWYSLLIIMLTISPAFGSEIYYSPKNLFSMSDVILIGEIIERDGEGVIKPGDKVCWQIRVFYYLKGGDNQARMTVTIPGEYYPAGSFKYVMLLLKEKNGSYDPFSPQGIVPLKLKNPAEKPGKGLVGKDVLDEFVPDLDNYPKTDVDQWEFFIMEIDTLREPAYHFPWAGMIKDYHISITIILGMMLGCLAAWFYQDFRSP